MCDKRVALCFEHISSIFRYPFILIETMQSAKLKYINCLFRLHFQYFFVYFFFANAYTRTNVLLLEGFALRYLTEEEVNIATKFLFLSMAIIVIQQDIHLIQTGAFKIKAPYVELLKRMASKALNERKRLRKQMQKHKLQVIPLEKNNTFSSYLFLCNGREEKRNYFNPTIQKKVETIILELMRKALQPDQSYAFANT